jgi:hypothetical protein
MKLLYSSLSVSVIAFGRRLLFPSKNINAENWEFAQAIKVIARGFFAS